MNFLKEFFRHPIHTGAIAPSSKALGELITDTANVANKKCVVEFGPGNGVFTEIILRKINPGCTFFSIEINDEFAKETKNRCPDAIVYNGSVKNIKKYLAKHNKKSCDCIISALPWALFNKKLQDELLDLTYDSLEEGGSFLTVAYVHGLFLPGGINFKKLLRSKFRTVEKTKVIWKNLPPAFVYHCKK